MIPWLLSFCCHACFFNIILLNEHEVSICDTAACMHVCVGAWHLKEPQGEGVGVDRALRRSCFLNLVSFPEFTTLPSTFTYSHTNGRGLL